MGRVRCVVSDDDLAGLDEFALLDENAEQIGHTGPLPTVTRVESGDVSGLKWGDESPQVVFLHGGGQNAHTWDTVILGPRPARSSRSTFPGMAVRPGARTATTAPGSTPRPCGPSCGTGRQIPDSSSACRSAG